MRKNRCLRAGCLGCWHGADSICPGDFPGGGFCGDFERRSQVCAIFVTLAKLLDCVARIPSESLSMLPRKNTSREHFEALLGEWFPDRDIALEQMRKQVQFVELPPDYEVFRRGDACRNYLVVLDGSVRVQALSPGGREVTLYRVTGGQSCVITTSCLIGRENYPAEGITESETTALVLSHGVFRELLGSSETFRRFVFASQGKRLSDLIHRVEDVAFGRVDARLARLLVGRSGSGSNRVSATHQQLASELGTAREVVSRQLKLFEKQGWIAVRRGAVEVHNAGALERVWKDTD